MRYFIYTTVHEILCSKVVDKTENERLLAAAYLSIGFFKNTCIFWNGSVAQTDQICFYHWHIVEIRMHAEIASDLQVDRYSPWIE